MIRPSPALQELVTQLDALLDAQEQLRARYHGGMAGMPVAVRARYEATERLITQLRATRACTLPTLTNHE